MSPEDFDIIALLGKGSFGEVFLVKEKKTGIKFAMKLLQKDKIVSNYNPKLTDRPESAKVRDYREKCSKLYTTPFHSRTALRLPD